MNGLINKFKNMLRYFNFFIDKITGFPLDSSLRKILTMDSWNRQEIDNYQHKMFERLREYAVKSSFYKPYIKRELKNFPVLTKETYTNELNKIITNFRKPYRIEYTSGSSGNPRKIVVSKEMLLAKRTSHLKMLHWYGLKREAKEVYIGGISKSMLYQLYYIFKNKIFLSSFNINKEKALKFIHIINRQKPDIVFSYPYALMVLLGYVEELNLQVYQPKLIYTGAENLYPEIAVKIKKHFPESYFVNEYWSTEANIGITCPSGSMHIDEDTIIPEVINKDENGVGDLLITNLFSYDAPIIRYQLGDKVKLSERECSCGRRTKIIETIMGRDIDYFILPDGRKIAFTENSIQIASLCENILAYQILHKSNTYETQFNYVKKIKNRPVNLDPLKDYFRKQLNISVTFNEVDYIETESSGKHKVFKTIA
jgi:phenylacetate-CoA ligase